MITSREYFEAVCKLMHLNNLYTVPGDKEDIEKQHLTEIISEYEANRQEFDHIGWPGDGSGEDDFADYNQNEGYDS
jgi:hypothetical protein